MYKERVFLSERALTFVEPAFSRLASWFPSKFGPPGEPQPHPSAMFPEKNFLYKSVFSGFVDRVSVDEQSLSNLKREAKNSTIVYVASSMGHLEYNYFAELLEREGLAPSIFCNALTSWRWLKWADAWPLLRSIEAEIKETGAPKDPSFDGTLVDAIANGASAFFIVPEQILGDDSRFHTGPVRLVASVAAAQKISTRPIKLVPIDFIWSRRSAGGQRSTLDLMFGEKESPGFVRRTVMFCKNFRAGARALIGRPIDVSEVVSDGLDEAATVAKLKLVIKSELGIERQATVGPQVRARSAIIEEVLSDETLDEEICKMAAGSGKPTDDVRDLALSYIKEIAADLDYTYIELVDRLVSPILRRLYENFDVATEGLSNARALCAEGPVVFVPNHKSHVDYMILSHIFYKNGLTVPHIAAGVNLRIWPLGKIFRRCGAYFIRRQFKGNQLYKMVLETYLKVLVKDGFSQEFFIEGGRSRTGRLKAPKLGMISMLSKAALDAKVPSIKFVPVTLTYDRVVEQKNYVEEAEGVEKSPEKTSHLIRLTKFLKPKQSHHGSIYVRFGEAVELPAGIDHTEQVVSSAFNISERINRMLVATPLAVSSTALLSGAQRAVLVEDLFVACDAVISVLRGCGAELSKSLTEFSTIESMQKAVTQLTRAKLVSMRDEAFWPYALIAEEKRMSLSFHKNSIAHFLVPAAAILLVAARASANNSVFYISEAETKYKDLVSLIANAYFPFAAKELQTKFASTLEVLHGLDLISVHSGTMSAPSADHIRVRAISSVVEPLIESLYIASAHCAHMVDSEIDQKMLVSAMQRTGLDLLNLGKIKYREALNRFDLEDALNFLQKMQILEKITDSGHKSQKITIVKASGFTSIQNLQVELESILKTPLN